MLTYLQLDMRLLPTVQLDPKSGILFYGTILLLLVLLYLTATTLAGAMVTVVTVIGVLLAVYILLKIGGVM